METHQKQWEFLKNKFEAGQFSHAYLFAGQNKIGKKDFAKEFIKLINCLYYKSQSFENRSIKKTPCGQCQNCNLIEKESFPDLLMVTSINSESSIKNERDSMEIDVAQIRQVNSFLSYKSYYGGYKAVIIENAERMNQEAQNCFLKTLEEPKGKTVIILVSSKPEMLLPTIFSRCQVIKFFSFEKHQESKEQEEALKSLLPIITAELAAKFQYAKKVNLEGDNFNVILEVLQRYFRNVMLMKIGAIKENPQFTSNYPILKIKKIIKLIENIRYQMLTTNANPKLALEILLLEL